METLFIEDTLTHFFIQGFYNKETIQETLKRRLDNLEEVKKIACIVEDIDKLQEQM